MGSDQNVLKDLQSEDISGLPENHFQQLVNKAVQIASASPCCSKRGVIVFDAQGQVVATGYNDQPPPFVCDSSLRCKSNCGQTAIHAEQRAILSLVGQGRLYQREHLSMLHVKAKFEMPCSSMAPSCLQCSKLILAADIPWMYLLHDPVAQLLPGCQVVAKVRGFRSDGMLDLLDVRRYSAASFHYLTAEYFHRITLKLQEAQI